MSGKPRRIPHAAIGRSAPIVGGDDYFNIRRTVHTTVTSPFRSRLSDQVKDNKQLLADGMISENEYKERKHRIVAKLREKRRKKQAAAQREEERRQKEEATIETASVATEATLASAVPSLGTAPPSEFSASVASEPFNNSAAENNHASTEDLKEPRQAKTKKKAKTKRKKNKRDFSAAKRKHGAHDNASRHSQPSERGRNKSTRQSTRRQGNKHSARQFDSSSVSSATFSLADNRTFRSSSTSWNKERRHSSGGRSSSKTNKENSQAILDSVEKKHLRRDDVLRDTIAHSSDKAMRGLNSDSLQDMAASARIADRDRPLFDMGRQFHGSLALEMEVLRNENVRLRHELVGRTQQLIKVEREFMRSKMEIERLKKRAKKYEKMAKLSNNKGGDNGDEPMIRDGDALKSPRAAQQALNMYRQTVAKLKGDNEALKVKLMRSESKAKKPSKKKKKPKRGRRDRVSAGLPTDESTLRMLLGIPEASLTSVVLPPGVRMGCIMEEILSNGISVVRVHTLQETARPGILVGDIVASVNGHSMIGHNLSHFAEQIDPATHDERTLVLFRSPILAGFNSNGSVDTATTASVRTDGVIGASGRPLPPPLSADDLNPESSRTQEEWRAPSETVQCPKCGSELTVPPGGQNAGFRCGHCDTALQASKPRDNERATPTQPQKKSKKGKVTFGRRVIHI